MSENTVFISWSKEPSKAVAEIFHTYLPLIVPNSKPFLSQIDIQKGAKGIEEIEKKLANAVFGIIIVTKANLKEPWIHYETGALSKGISDNQVSPFLFNVSLGDIAGTPLQHRQFTKFEKKELIELFKSIGRCVSPVANEKTMEEYLKKFLPDMLELLQASKSEPKKEEPSRQEILFDALLTRVNIISSKLNEPRRILPEEYLTQIMGGIQTEDAVAHSLKNQIDEVKEGLSDLEDEVENVSSKCSDIVFDLDSVIDDLLKGDNFEAEFDDELKELKRIVEELKALEGDIDWLPAEFPQFK